MRLRSDGENGDCDNDGPGTSTMNPGLSLTSSSSRCAWRRCRRAPTGKSSHSPSRPSLWKGSAIGVPISISILTSWRWVIHVKKGAEEEYEEANEAPKEVDHVAYSKGPRFLESSILSNINHFAGCSFVRLLFK